MFDPLCSVFPIEMSIMFHLLQLLSERSENVKAVALLCGL